MRQNPESYENDLNHFGIIVESYLNHSLREPQNGEKVVEAERQQYAVVGGSVGRSVGRSVGPSVGRSMLSRAWCAFRPQAIKPWSADHTPPWDTACVGHRIDRGLTDR